jgi:hypothetical protein
MVFSLGSVDGLGWEDDSEWRIATGFDFSSGDYGDELDTDIFYIPMTMKFIHFPWTARVTVPYLQITGAGNVVGGVDGGIVVDDVGAQQTTEAGLGDVVASLTYSLDSAMTTATLIDLQAKVKLPTADADQGLGTGESDYSFQIDLARAYGPVMPFATFGYQFMGESDTFALDDRAYLSLGAGYKLGPKMNVGILYDFREAASASADDAQELLSYATWKASQNWVLNSYVSIGLTDGSPNRGVGTQLSYRF